MKKLQICCPICSKFKLLPVPKEIFDIDEGSLLKLPIQKGIVCAHSFLCVIDYNFSIRDYEIIKTDEDFQKYQQKANRLNKLWTFNYF
jgi:hypothetical protein